MAKRDFHKMIVGRSEQIDIVGHVEAVPAKADTGAYRSAIHANNISEKDGTLNFTLLGGHPYVGSKSIKLSTTKFRKITVSNSFGHEETRYEVNLKVKLGSRVFTSPFSLANRSKKLYPILLGRLLLSNRFIVDTSKSGVDIADVTKRFKIRFLTDEEEGRR